MSRTVGCVRIQGTTAFSQRPAPWSKVEQRGTYSLYSASIGGTSYYLQFNGGTTPTEVKDNQLVYKNYEWKYSASGGYYYLEMSNSCRAEYFDVTYYTIQFTSGGNGSVSVASRDVAQGASVTCTATGNAHYKFDHWSDGSTSATKTVVANSDTTFTAYFVRSEYNVKVGWAGTQGGAYFTVGSSSSHLTQSWVPTSSRITLVANGTSASRFVKWTDDKGSAYNNSTVTPLNVGTPTQDINYTANFATAYVKTSASGSGVAYVGATGTLTQKYFSSGDTVTIRASATDSTSTGFIGWFLSSDTSFTSPVSTNATYTFTFSGSSIQLVARFQSKVKTYTVSPSDSRYGSAVVMYNGISQGGQFAAPWGSTIRLSAAIVDADVGGEHIRGAFGGWYDANDTAFENLLYSGMEWVKTVPSGDYGSESYVAKFTEASKCALTVNVQDGDGHVVVDRGTVEVSEGVAVAGDEGKYYSGQTSFLASPATGYEVVGWLVNGSQQGTISGNEFSFDLQSDSIVTAVIVKQRFDISRIIDQASFGCGSIALYKFVSGSYELVDDSVVDVEYGTACRIIVTKTTTGSPTYVFRKLTANGEPVATSEVTAGSYSYDFTVTSQMSFVAFFGDTVTVSPRRYVDGSWEVDSYGTAFASLIEGTRTSTSADFTFGDTVYIEAVSVEAGESDSAFFVGWRHVSGQYVSDKVVGIGAEASITPTANSDYPLSWYAEFTAEPETVYIHLNNGRTSFGVLSLVGIDSNARVTELTPAQFDAALDEYYDESGSASQTGTTDKFYSVVLGKRVAIICEESNPQSTPFVKWTKKEYTARSEFTEESDISESSTAEFVVLGNCVVYAKYNSSAPSKLTVRYANGSAYSMGRLQIVPTGTNSVTSEILSSGDFVPNTTVSIVAMPSNGYRFDGWYEDAEAYTRKAQSEFLKGVGSETYYAKFIQDENAIYQWEGSMNNKTMTWRTRRTRFAQPLNLSSAAICAEGYPVTMRFAYASSPDPAANGWRTTEINLFSQDPRRIPLARPERYLEIEIESDKAVLQMSAASGMQGLIIG